MFGHRRIDDLVLESVVLVQEQDYGSVLEEIALRNGLENVSIGVQAVLNLAN